MTIPKEQPGDAVLSGQAKISPDPKSRLTKNEEALAEGYRLMALDVERELQH